MESNYRILRWGNNMIVAKEEKFDFNIIWKHSRRNCKQLPWHINGDVLNSEHDVLITASSTWLS